MIVQSQEGTQYSHNTSHVKKLLQNSDVPSKQEETVTETHHELEEPTQQQGAVQEPKAAEPDIPLRRPQRHRVAPDYLKDYHT